MDQQELEQLNASLDDLLSSCVRVRKIASTIPKMIKSTNAVLAYESRLGIEVERAEEYIEGLGWEYDFGEDEWERIKKGG